MVADSNHTLFYPYIDMNSYGRSLKEMEGIVVVPSTVRVLMGSMKKHSQSS